MMQKAKQLAAGNIDGLPGNEVVGCGNDRTVKVLDGLGNLLWSSPQLNVEEDGTIPTVEAANYLQSGLNNFRLNKQPGGEFSAPDAIVSVAPKCAGDYGLIANVRNIGEAALPAGVEVGFYAGTAPNGTLLGTGATSFVLHPLESENVVLLLPNASSDITSGQTPVYAIVDDTTEPHPAWTECRSDNNTSEAVSAECGQVG